MLSPSDFNNAVPQFTNGNYASNPLNPQYIAEPSSTDYNRGVEPLTTLPAQWWNWFLNKFTSRFNKVNIYVKNIFNELSQLLSLSGITPDGTEGTPTTGQLNTMFSCCYPNYVKTTLGLGTASTVNTGTASGCVPIIGCVMGTTDNNIVVTDTTGKLKPSGTVLGTAAGCDASCFRPSTWTPTTVTNACNVWKCMATANTNRQLLLGEASESNSCGMVYVGNSCKATFNPGTGVLTAPTFCGSLSGTATSATCVVKTVSGASQAGVIYFCTNCTNASCASTARTTCICGANGFYYGNVCGCLCGLATRAGYTTCLYNRPGSVASAKCDVFLYVGCTNASCSPTNYAACLCGANGLFYANGAVFSHASYACALTVVRDCASGAPGICFKRQTTGWGSIAFCASNTVGRYTADGATFYKFIDSSMVGTASALNTGTAAGCIPTIGSALGTTANKIVLTTASGTLQPSSNVIGSAAYCAASCFLTSTGCAADSAKLGGYTPSNLCVACSGNATFAELGRCAVCGYSLRCISVTGIKNRSQLCEAFFCGESKTCGSFTTCNYTVCFKVPTLHITCSNNSTVICYHEEGFQYGYSMTCTCSIDYGRACFDSCCMKWIRFI